MWTTAWGDRAMLIIREDDIDPFEIVAVSLVVPNTTVVENKVTSFYKTETDKH